MIDTSRVHPEPGVFVTRHGQSVVLRQVEPDDTALLVQLLCSLSAQTYWLRFAISRPLSLEVAWREAARMVQGRTPDHTTLVATVRHHGYDEAVAVAELVRVTHTPPVSEMAIVVRDDYHAQGIGSALVRQLVAIARLQGTATVRADTLAENAAVRRLIAGLGVPYTATTRDGETEFLFLREIGNDERGDVS